jgi:hypothetical protein
MLAAFCALMDDWCTLSYLETDRSENVSFYQKFGFTVVAEAEVLAVPNWFMSRPARIAEKGSHLPAAGGDGQTGRNRITSCLPTFHS